MCCNLMVVLSIVSDVYSVIMCWCSLMLCLVFCFKQKTAYEMRISDWSSDVCSSDLSFERLKMRVSEATAARKAFVALPEQRMKALNEMLFGGGGVALDRKSVV